MRIPFMINDKSNKDGEKVIKIPINEISYNRYQPRINFDDEEIKGLALSIQNYGVIQPITVRRKGDQFELIAGERRLRASKHLGLSEIPAIVKELSEEEVAAIALVENLQRKDLNFLEESRAYQQILTKFNLKQKELAAKIGKSQSTIANKLRILTLPAEILKELNSPLISERHARLLLNLTEREKQLEVINLIKEQKLTVKETEKIIAQLQEKRVKEKRVIKTYFKDLRVFTNTLHKSVQEMKKGGLEVKVDKREEQDYIEFRIRLPKN